MCFGLSFNARVSLQIDPEEGLGENRGYDITITEETRYEIMQPGGDGREPFSLEARLRGKTTYKAPLL